MRRTVYDFGFLSLFPPLSYAPSNGAVSAGLLRRILIRSADVKEEPLTSRKRVQFLRHKILCTTAVRLLSVWHWGEPLIHPIPNQYMGDLRVVENWHSNLLP